MVTSPLVQIDILTFWGSVNVRLAVAAEVILQVLAIAPFASED